MVSERFWEIDALRGIAVCLMIIFHFLFDLNYFKNFSFDLSAGLWLFVGRTAALVFIFLVGVSLTLSFSKGRSARHFLKRGLKILFLGLLVTLITFLLFPQETVWFGVLHLIGFSIILAVPFLKFKKLNVLLGFALIVAGLLLWNFSFNFAFLLPLGIQPEGFASFDYFPLLPWFGVVLLGIAFGNWFYPERKRSFRIPELRIPILQFLGRNSLLVYFLHQPVIIGVLLLFF